MDIIDKLNLFLGEDLTGQGAGEGVAVPDAYNVKNISQQHPKAPKITTSKKLKKKRKALVPTGIKVLR